MNKLKISFSSQGGGITRADLNVTSKISEEYFGTVKDPEQVPTTRATREWIYQHAQEYLNIIKNDRAIIGFAFLLPCTKPLMKKFLTKKIGEATLFEQIKKVEFADVPDALYLCAAIVKNEFQRQGLAARAFVAAIKKITQNIKKKPTLFYWGYSEEGKRLCESVARRTGLELRARAKD